jgi:L-threonylcarbamoyladenylate synthase
MSVSTKVLPANEAGAIEEAVRVLQQGGLVVFPTDTVYGIGALGHDAAAVGRLFEVKGRPTGKSIPLLIGRVEDLTLVAKEVPEAANQLIEAFWPGGLTLVVPRSDWVPDVVTSGGSTVAVRQPDHLGALELIRAAGEPLATTSANLSGEPSAVIVTEVVHQLFGRVDLILDGGRCPGGTPSTVVDLSGEKPRLLREGAISRAKIEAVVAQLV